MMKAEYIDLFLWIFAILIVATIIFAVRLKLFHKATKQDVREYTTNFLLTIIGTTVGFALVTVSTLYLERINDKEELLTLLTNVFKELDINYKVLRDRSQDSHTVSNHGDLELRSRFEVDIPIQFTFIDDLYEKKNTYKYLSEPFTKNRLVIIYRGTEYCLEQLEINSPVHTDFRAIELINNLSLYKTWVKTEGIKIAGSEENWNKSVRIFDTWDQLTQLYSR